MAVVVTKDQRIKVLEMQVKDLQERLLRLERGELDTARVHWSRYEVPCNCAAHERGQTTGGWDCPRHGHQL